MSKKVEEIENQYTSDKNRKGNDNKRKCVLLDEGNCIRWDIISDYNYSIHRLFVQKQSNDKAAVA